MNYKLFEPKMDIDRNELLNRLEELNSKLQKENVTFHMYLFGSGLGMFHMGNSYRKSFDIDYQTNDIIFNQNIVNTLNNLEIHEIGGIMNLPPLEELNIVETLKYSNLFVYIPDLESFAFSKLMTDRIKDYRDLELYPILDNCNIDKIKFMLDEYLPYFIFADNKNYNFNYLDDLIESRNLNGSLKNKESDEDEFCM